jgi:hypothetical protein
MWRLLVMRYVCVGSPSMADVRHAVLQTGVPGCTTMAVFAWLWYSTVLCLCVPGYGFAGGVLLGRLMCCSTNSYSIGHRPPAACVSDWMQGEHAVHAVLLLFAYVCTVYGYA